VNQVVVCAAVKFADGHIALGSRHYSPLMRANLKALYCKYDVSQWPREIEQGFIDNRDRFITRQEAARIALTAGQITDTELSTLHSEDLY